MQAKCKYASRYKGNRKPMCNRDVGCIWCWRIYQEKRNYSFIDNWSIQSGSDNPYLAPELAGISICGEVYNHKYPNRHPDGKRIRTSHVTKVDGRIVHTSSGSIYVLGNPDDDYVKFCEKNGHYVPTDKEPIRVRFA